jgi:hypothetical protein
MAHMGDDLDAVTVEMGSVSRGSRMYLRDGTLAGTVDRMTNNIGTYDSNFCFCRYFFLTPIPFN